MTRAVYDLMPNQPHYFMFVGSTEFHVVQFEVDEAINSPGVLRASVIGYDASLDLQSMIGEEVLLDIHFGKRDDEKTRVFHGVVQHFELRGTDEAAAYFDVVAVPQIWTLSLRHRSAVHVTDRSQNSDVKKVIERIMTNAGMAAKLKFELSRSYEPYSFLAQYRQTDLEFIHYLCEREGICYTVDHQTDQEYYVFTDHSADLPAVTPYDEILVRRTSGAMVDEYESIEHFTCRHQMTFGKAEYRDYDFKNANRRIFDSHTGTSDNQNEYYFDTAGFSDQETAKNRMKRLAQNKTEAFNASIIEGSGFGNYRALTAGKMFTAVGADSSSLNRKWLCTSVHYEGKEDAHVDQDQAAMGGGGSGYKMSFTAIPSDVTYRPLSTTPAPVIQGAQTAIVVGPDGQEIHTDSYGRIKIQMHWDRSPTADSRGDGANYDTNSSFWCRVSQQWAGNGWGIFALPRIGQEVLVDFVGGDPNYPIVVGSLHNSVQPPPYALPDHQTRTTIKTNSTPGGDGFNELRFEDKKGSEQIFMHAEKNLDVRVKNDSMEGVGGHRHITVGSNEGGGNLRELYYGNNDIEIKMNKQELIKQDNKLTIKGNHHFQIEKDSKTKINGKADYAVTGDQTEKIGGKFSLSVTGDSHISVTGDNLSSSTGAFHINGQEVVINGLSGITLMAGASFIKLDASGIKLMGPSIMVNSGGAPGMIKPPMPGMPDMPTAATPEAPTVADDDVTGKKSTESGKPS